MSQPFVFANNVSTTLAGAISNTATTISLASSANFPTIPSGYVWAITLNDAATQQDFEICYATANLGSGQLQVLRGQEGTTARAWNVGDFVYAADTAGILSSFINGSQLSGFVELSPPSMQTGSINVSGSISGRGQGSFVGVAVGGALSGATTGAFSSDVTALDLITTRGYTNTAIASLPVRFNSSGGSLTGIGPSSGLSVSGITGSMLAIGNSSSGRLIVMDTSGSLAAYNNIYAGGSLNAGTLVAAPEILQGGVQVVSAISSPDGSITVVKSGSSVTLKTTSAGGGGQHLAFRSSTTGSTAPGAICTLAAPSFNPAVGTKYCLAQINIPECTGLPVNSNGIYAVVSLLNGTLGSSDYGYEMIIVNGSTSTIGSGASIYVDIVCF